jgi:hypothetical protein
MACKTLNVVGGGIRGWVDDALPRAITRITHGAKKNTDNIINLKI